MYWNSNSLLSIVTIAPLIRGDDCKKGGRTESTAEGKGMGVFIVCCEKFAIVFA